MINYIRFFLLITAATIITPQAYGGTFSSEHERVQKLFQSNQEKTAKDAIWTAKDIFKVGVINDGSKRDGYARYVCEVLYDHGFKGMKVWVQVIDIVKLTRNGDWVKLGEARCQ